MKETHIILRNPRPATRDVFLGLQPYMTLDSTVGAVSNLAIEVEDIEREQLPTLSKHADVLAIAPDMPIKLIEPAQTSTPLTLRSGISWGIKAVGADISPFSGDGVLVAVLDTGIDRTHSAFAGVQLSEKDFTGEGVRDQHGHGTHCAGIIFGRDTDGTRIGVALGVRKALIGKVLGKQGGSSAQIVQAIQWAVNEGAQVISMSLGMDFPGAQKKMQDKGFPPELATSRALEAYRANVQLFDRLASLVRAGSGFLQTSLLIAAAGNESQRDRNPDFEIAVSPPAVSEGFISVAALGESSSGYIIAPFSNTGANISGPGVQITSAKLGGGLTAMSGTSMATPHVAGVAALWAEKIAKAHKPMNVMQWTAMLLSSAVTDRFATGFNPFNVGAGMVQAPHQ